VITNSTTAPAIAETARAIAAELLDRASTASERVDVERTASDFAPRRPIAEDAESLGGSLPVDDIAQREDRGQ
jgi:hypothetical protein